MKVTKGVGAGHRPREDTCVLQEKYLERVAGLDQP